MHYAPKFYLGRIDLPIIVFIRSEGTIDKKDTINLFISLPNDLAHKTSRSIDFVHIIEKFQTFADTIINH